MISDLGATFSPSDPTQPKAPVSPVQQAVQLLSVNMPRVVGAETPVAPSLLAGVGGVHPAVANAVVRSVLAALFGSNRIPGSILMPGAPGSETANLAGAVAGASGVPVGPGAGPLLAPPQFTFSNPSPPVTAGPTPSGAPRLSAGGGPLPPPSLPAGLGMGTGDPRVGSRGV